jgi:hypothetical protein
MVNIGDQFNYHGTWYKVTEINGNMVTTIEDPDLNRHSNVRDFTYWGLQQVKEIINGDIN